MDETQEKRLKTYSPVAKTIGIGCGALMGISFCAMFVFLPLMLLPIVGIDLFLNTDLPFSIEQAGISMTILVVVLGSLLGGVGGYFLFYRLAFKSGQRKAEAHQQAQITFDKAIEEAVDKALEERGIEK